MSVDNTYFVASKKSSLATFVASPRHSATAPVAALMQSLRIGVVTLHRSLKPLIRRTIKTTLGITIMGMALALPA